jgi:hypothetical protein
MWLALLPQRSGHPCAGHQVTDEDSETLEAKFTCIVCGWWSEPSNQVPVTPNRWLSIARSPGGQCGAT